MPRVTRVATVLAADAELEDGIRFDSTNLLIPEFNSTELSIAGRC